MAALVVVDGAGKTLLLPPPKKRGKTTAEPDDVPTLVSRMWHFPTVSVRPESAEIELRKFAENSFPCKKKIDAELAALKAVEHAVTYRAVRVLPFLAVVKKLPSFAGAKVLRLEKVSEMAISNLTRKVALAAEKRFQR